MGDREDGSQRTENRGQKGKDCRGVGEDSRKFIIRL